MGIISSCIALDLEALLSSSFGVLFLLLLVCGAVLCQVLAGMDVPGQNLSALKVGVSDFSSVHEVNLGFLFLGGF